MVRAFSAIHEASIWWVHLWWAQHFATQVVWPMVPCGFGCLQEETMPNQVPRCAKIWAGWEQKLTQKFMVFDVGQHV